MEIPRRYSQISEIPLPRHLNQKVYPRPGQRPYIVKLDPGIEKLVRVINGLGMHTTGSCEGHMNSHRHPWVQIAGLQYPEFWVRRKMVKLADEYTDQNPPDKPLWIVEMWRHDEAWLRTQETGNDEEGLTGLRLSADDFANFLFNKYLSMNK